MFLFGCQVISQLKVLMRSNLEAHKFDKEKWSTELSPILNLWKKLNQVSSTFTSSYETKQTVSPRNDTLLKKSNLLCSCVKWLLLKVCNRHGD